MNTTHTVQGTIDNAMNITEAISMLTSRYKGCTKLSIERKEVKGNTRYPSKYPEYGYEYTMEYEDTTYKPSDAYKPPYQCNPMRSMSKRRYGAVWKRQGTSMPSATARGAMPNNDTL